jgi:hypothetical protein
MHGIAYMMTHLLFFSFGERGGGGTNSPAAISSEACPSGCNGKDHPPGKIREVEEKCRTRDFNTSSFEGLSDASSVFSSSSLSPCGLQSVKYLFIRMIYGAYSSSGSGSWIVGNVVGD